MLAVALDKNGTPIGFAWCNQDHHAEDELLSSIGERFVYEVLVVKATVKDGEIQILSSEKDTSRPCRLCAQLLTSYHVKYVTFTLNGELMRLPMNDVLVTSLHSKCSRWAHGQV